MYIIFYFQLTKYVQNTHSKFSIYSVLTV